MAQTPLPRRDFLRQAALAGFIAGFPTLIPASALGKDGAVAPSNRIQVAGVGLLGMGLTDLSWLISQKGVQVVAVCDVDTQGLDKGTQLVKSKGQAAPNRYQDFREMLAKEELDAASIAVPDHWHAAISIPFLKAGVDVYGEKPLAKTLTEGRAMVDAVKAYGRIWQTGMWQRSTANFRRAVELVRNGAIGKVKRVEVGTGPCNHQVPGGKPGPVPTNLDYDLWVGPSAWMDYDPRRTHFNWRWHHNFGGGQLVDWVCHHVDIAAWGLGKDLEYPEKVVGKGGELRAEPWNCHRDYDYTLTYADGTEIVVTSKNMGAKFIGETGTVFVDRGRQSTSDPKLWDAPLGEDAWRCPGIGDHAKEFIDCVRTRRRPVAHVEVAHHTTLLGHLGLAAIFTGRKLRFDGKTERFINDEGGNALLTRELRKPWSLT